MIEKVDKNSMENIDGHDLWFSQTIVSVSHIIYIFFPFSTLLEFYNCTVCRLQLWLYYIDIQLIFLIVHKTVKTYLYI